MRRDEPTVNRTRDRESAFSLTRDVTLVFRRVLRCSRAYVVAELENDPVFTSWGDTASTWAATIANGQAGPSVRVFVRAWTR